jgi:hypothetical protein
MRNPYRNRSGSTFSALHPDMGAHQPNAKPVHRLVLPKNQQDASQPCTGNRRTLRSERAMM